MTRPEAIKVINIHLEHWERLLREKICDKTEGAETICAFKMSIEALQQPQIIYCKDCKYYRGETFPNGKKYGDFCKITHYERKPDDFCSRAEVNL